MDPSSFDHFAWRRPWQPISKGHRDAYELELRSEASPWHKLHNVRATAVARTCNGDDVLFVLHDHPFPLAVVHLTFTGRIEPSPQWPTFRYFENVKAWVRHSMNVDAAEFEAKIKFSA